MRALCGAIISAGALIGLGLTALGYGLRYGSPVGPGPLNPSTNAPWGAPSLTLILIILILALVVGLITAFMGLAFHHYRRYHEHLRATGRPVETHVPV